MKNPNATDPTRAPSSPTSKTTYKDYQKFLQIYNENKSDGSSSPTPLSTNSSTSSVPSMISETDNVPVAFNEYLQSYKSKKFSTVKPTFPKKNVKTELFIQVGEEDDNDGLLGRRYNTLKSRKTPGKVILTRNNSLNKCDGNKGPLSPAGHQTCLSPPPQKQKVVSDEMIYAKTALLNELCSKPPKLNKSPSPPVRSPVEVSNILMSVSSLPPPPPKLPDFTSNTPPISSTVRKVTPARTSQPKPNQNQNRPSFITEMQSKFKENSQNRLPPRLPTVGLTQNGVIPNNKSPVPSNPEPPVPPKFPTQHLKSSDVEVTISGQGQNERRSPPIAIIPNLPPPPQKFINQQKKTLSSRNQNGAQNGQSNFLGVTSKKSPPPLMTNGGLPAPPPKFLSQPKTLDVEPITTTYVPVTDNAANIDKKDPNVKKLVYNTYRGLLGAYNNKANTMVSLPKNRVVQDQGVAKQLESMELQGCLDKLNGRVNPSGENE